jgi:hypothetical protein
LIYIKQTKLAHETLKLGRWQSLGEEISYLFTCRDGKLSHQALLNLVTNQMAVNL